MKFFTAQSAQLGHTVPFTLVQAGKYRPGDKLKIQRIHKLNKIQKKETTQKNYHCPVAFYGTRPGNEVGLFNNAPSPHGAG